MLRLPLRTRGLTVGLLTFLYGMGVQSQAPPVALPPDPLVFAGSGPGGGMLRVFAASGTPLVTVSPFGGGFIGGVHVAAGDVNGDGVTDVIAGMASGGGEVRVFSGTDGTSLGTSTPFGASVTGGVFVAAGDVNADGHDDLLLGAGAGGGLARLFDGATQRELGSGLPFPPAYTGGVTVAMGDVNGDGLADLIFGTAMGGFVRVFDGATLTELASGFPYGPLFFGGVNVAAGDVNGDGIDEVALAPRNAGGPVRVYNLQAQLLAEGNVFSGVQGVSLALADLNADGRDDLVMGAGAGAQPRVRAFSIVDRTLMLDLLALDAGFTGGVFVATPSSARTRFTSGNAATFTVGVPGTFTVTTANGTDTVLSVGGTLPAGVTFTDNHNGTATLAGTPAAGTGGTYALNFVATRGAGQVASQPFTLTVQQAAGISSAANAVFATSGTNTFTVMTTGHPTATTIGVTGVLPAGVTFTNNGNGTATIAGSPSAGSEGTYPLAVTASNGVGSPATQAFTLTVVAGDTPLFSSANATTFTVGAVGSFSVLTSATPVASSISVTGTLPPGVTFTNHGNGTATLAGVPDTGTAGTYPLVFTANNGVASTPQTFTLTVAPVAGGAPSFTSGNAITFVVGTAGDFRATTTGFPVAATLTSSGALPSGITFTNNGDGTASLAGTAAPGTAGSYPIQFTADNGVGTATQLFTLTINNISASPVFTNGATTALVIGTAGTFAISTAASPAVTAITLTGALPTGVTFTDNGDGTAALAGTPQAGTAGPYALTFTATNGGAPVAQAFTLSVQETAAITSANARAFTVGIADSFIVTTAGLPVPSVARTGTLPAGVTYTDNSDGTATIAGTAAAGTVGAYPLTLTATNGVGTPGTQTFTLNVTENTPPTLDAVPNPAPIPEDSALQTITLTGITAGAGDSQPLGVTASSSDTAIIPHPTVTYATPAPTGTLQYTPVANAFGTAIITVTVTDGGLDNDLGTIGDNGVVSRMFTVTVNAVNDTPTLDAIPNPAPIAEDAPQQTINLSGIAAGGGETQNLQVTATSGNTALLPDPTVTYASPGATGSLAYTPVANQQGSAVVTVTVTDGGDDNNLGTPGDNLTVTRTFTVDVTEANDPPTLDAIPDPAAINEDAGQQTVNLTGITAGGETQVLQVTATSDAPGFIPNPAVTYVSPNATGSLAYTPVANTFGTAIVTVTVTDGGLDDNLGTPGDNATVTRTFSVTVNAVNDAPTFTPGGNQTVSEDAAGVQTVNPFLTSLLAGPTNEAGQIISVDITNVQTPSLFAVPPAIGPTGVLTYTLAAEQSGSSTVTYVVKDDGGTANGGIDAAAPVTFTITVNPVNDAPTLDAIPDPAAINEDAGLQTVNLAGITAGGGETQPLQVTASSGNAAILPDATVTYTTPGATGSLSYAPVAQAFGTVVVTVTVTDGGLDGNLGTAGDNGTLQRQFTVTINSVNDAPTFIAGGNQTVGEDTPGVQTVNAFLTSLSAGPANEAGQTLSVDITNVQTPGLFAVPPAISATGVLTYTLAAEQFGSSTVTYVVRDNGGTANGGSDAAAPVTFTITVNAVNDPPTLNAISDPAAILEDAAQQTVNLAGIGTGSAAESAQPLQVTAVSNNTAVIPNPTVTYVSPNATGTLDYTPVANAFGSAVITVTVTDGGLDNDLGTAGDNGTVVDTFTVNVTSVNDAPTFTKGGDQTVLEDAVAQTVNPWATGISAGPGEGAQILTFEITGNTNTGLFSAGPSVSPATGVLTFTPFANQNGSATITLRITDDGGTTNGGIDASATQTFVITIDAVNDAPVAQAKSFTAQANMQISGLSGLLTGVTDADSGINGCTPTFSVANVSTTTPAGGNITNLNTTAGTFDFNPPPGVTGNVTFTYTVSDTGCPGTETSAPATVTINVAGPVIWFVDPAALSNGDGRLTSPFQFLANNAGADAADVHAANHRIFIYSGSVAGGLNLNANEWLVGQGASGASFDTLMGIAPPTGTAPRPTIGGARPTVTHTTSTTVTLAGGNVIAGLNVTNTNGAGIAGSNVGTLALSDFDITVTGGSALSLTTSGTVTATGTDNDLTSTTGTALNVANVTIGAAGLTFKSLTAGNNTAAADPVNGIVLNTTGSSGGLTVTGTDGGDAGTVPDPGTGGTIQHTTGHGVSLTNTAALRLGGMNIVDNLGSGISGSTINGFVLDGVTVSGNGNDAASDESGINITELTGTAAAGARPTAITNSTISNNNEFELQITNTIGILTDFRLTGNAISSNGLPINGNVSSPHGNLVNFLALGTATMTLNATGGTFTGNWNPASPPVTITATGIQADHSGSSGLMTANISGATFTNNNNAVTVSNSNGGALDFDVTTNTATGNRSHGLNLFVAANSTNAVTGSFTNNVVGTAGATGSGSSIGFPIRVQNEGVDTSNPVTVLISGNTVRESESFTAINVNLGIAAQLTTKPANITITNNIVSDVDSGRAITIQQNNSTNTTGSAGVVNATISGNNLDADTIAGQAGDGTVIRVRQLTGGTFNLTQLAPTAAANPNELDDANSVGGNPVTPAQISIGGTITFGAPLPPLP